jgi:hypothetical protein
MVITVFTVFRLLTVILSVYVLLSFDFPFVRLFGVRCKRAIYLDGEISLADARCTHLRQVIRSQNKIMYTVLNILNIYIHWIRVITKLPNSEQSYKGKVKTQKYINRQNHSQQPENCENRNDHAKFEQTITRQHVLLRRESQSYRWKHP